jgi:hypothetical protein
VSATLKLAAEVLEGTVAPAALVIDVVPSALTVPDLSVATDADLHVLRGDGTTETWTCTMSDQTSTSLRLTHPWDSTDTDTPFEQIIIYARLTLPSGVRRLRPARITVRPESSP